MELTTIFQALRRAHQKETLALIEHGWGPRSVHYWEIGNHCAHRIEYLLEYGDEERARRMARMVRLMARRSHLTEALARDRSEENRLALEAFDLAYPEVIKALRSNESLLQKAS